MEVYTVTLQFRVDADSQDEAIEKVESLSFKDAIVLVDLFPKYLLLDTKDDYQEA
jgi:hypothetical protein